MFSVEKKVYVSVFITSLLASCGTEIEHTSDVKIVGGEEVLETQNDPRRFSTVALTSEDRIAKGKSYCTGTIIDKKAIITAAHCLYDGDKKLEDSSLMRVSFGIKVGVAEAQYRKVKAVHQHSNFDITRPLFRKQDDVAVLILSEDIPSGYKPVSIVDKNLNTPIFQAMRLSGFGVNFSRKENTTGVLRQVDSMITEYNSFTYVFQTGDQFHGKGACPGDSGGPAFVVRDEQYYVMGVLSTGYSYSDGRCLGMNHYTDLRYYSGFISTALSLQ